MKLSLNSSINKPENDNVCICNAGWTGSACEVEMCPSNCSAQESIGYCFKEGSNSVGECVCGKEDLGCSSNSSLSVVCLRLHCITIGYDYSIFREHGIFWIIRILLLLNERRILELFTKILCGYMEEYSLVNNLSQQISKSIILPQLHGIMWQVAHLHPLYGNKCTITKALLP